MRRNKSKFTRKCYICPDFYERCTDNETYQTDAGPECNTTPSIPPTVDEQRIIVTRSVANRNEKNELLMKVFGYKFCRYPLRSHFLQGPHLAPNYYESEDSDAEIQRRRKIRRRRRSVGAVLQDGNVNGGNSSSQLSGDSKIRSRSHSEYACTSKKVSSCEDENVTEEKPSVSVKEPKIICYTCHLKKLLNLTKSEPSENESESFAEKIETKTICHRRKSESNVFHTEGSEMYRENQTVNKDRSKSESAPKVRCEMSVAKTPLSQRSKSESNVLNNKEKNISVVKTHKISDGEPPDNPSVLKKIASRRKSEGDGLKEVQSSKKLKVESSHKNTADEKTPKKICQRRKSEGDGLKKVQSCKKSEAESSHETTADQKTPKKISLRRKSEGDGLKKVQSFSKAEVKNSHENIAQQEIPKKICKGDGLKKVQSCNKSEAESSQETTADQKIQKKTYQERKSEGDGLKKVQSGKKSEAENSHGTTADQKTPTKIYQRRKSESDGLKKVQSCKESKVESSHKTVGDKKMPKKIHQRRKSESNGRKEEQSCTKSKLESSHEKSPKEIYQRRKSESDGLKKLQSCKESKVESSHKTVGDEKMPKKIHQRRKSESTGRKEEQSCTKSKLETLHEKSPKKIYQRRKSEPNIVHVNREKSTENHPTRIETSNKIPTHSSGCLPDTSKAESKTIWQREKSDVSIKKVESEKSVAKNKTESTSKEIIAKRPIERRKSESTISFNKSREDASENHSCKIEANKMYPIITLEHLSDAIRNESKLRKSSLKTTEKKPTDRSNKREDHKDHTEKSSKKVEPKRVSQTEHSEKRKYSSDRTTKSETKHYSKHDKQAEEHKRITSLSPKRRTSDDIKKSVSKNENSKRSSKSEIKSHPHNKEKYKEKSSTSREPKEKLSAGRIEKGHSESDKNSHNKRYSESDSLKKKEKDANETRKRSESELSHHKEWEPSKKVRTHSKDHGEKRERSNEKSTVRSEVTKYSQKRQSTGETSHVMGYSKDAKKSESKHGESYKKIDVDATSNSYEDSRSNSMVMPEKINSPQCNDIRCSFEGIFTCSTHDFGYFQDALHSRDKNLPSSKKVSFDDKTKNSPQPVCKKVTSERKSESAAWTSSCDCKAHTPMKKEKSAPDGRPSNSLIVDIDTARFQMFHEDSGNDSDFNVDGRMACQDLCKRRVSTDTEESQDNTSRSLQSKRTFNVNITAVETPGPSGKLIPVIYISSDEENQDDADADVLTVEDRLKEMFHDTMDSERAKQELLEILSTSSDNLGIAVEKSLMSDVVQQCMESCPPGEGTLNQVITLVDKCGKDSKQISSSVQKRVERKSEEGNVGIKESDTTNPDQKQNAELKSDTVQSDMTKMEHYKKRLIHQHEKPFMEPPAPTTEEEYDSPPQSPTNHDQNGCQERKKEEVVHSRVARKRAVCRSKFRHQNLELFKLGASIPTSLCKTKEPYNVCTEKNLQLCCQNQNGKKCEENLPKESITASIINTMEGHKRKDILWRSVSLNSDKSDSPNKFSNINSGRHILPAIVSEISDRRRTKTANTRENKIATYERTEKVVEPDLVIRKADPISINKRKPVVKRRKTVIGIENSGTDSDFPNIPNQETESELLGRRKSTCVEYELEKTPRGPPEVFKPTESDISRNSPINLSLKNNTQKMTIANTCNDPRLYTKQILPKQYNNPTKLAASVQNPPTKVVPQSTPSSVPTQNIEPPKIYISAPNGQTSTPQSYALGRNSVTEPTRPTSSLAQNHEPAKNYITPLTHGSTRNRAVALGTPQTALAKSCEPIRVKAVASINSNTATSNLWQNRKPSMPRAIGSTDSPCNLSQKHESARNGPVASTKSTTTSDLPQNNKPLRDRAVGAINSSTASSMLYQNHELPKNRVVGSANSTTSRNMYQSHELARDKDVASTNSAPSSNFYQNHEPSRDRVIGSTTTASNLYQRHELTKERPVASTKGTTSGNLYQNNEPLRDEAVGAINSSTASSMLYQNHELPNRVVGSANSTTSRNMYQNHEPSRDRVIGSTTTASNLYQIHELARERPVASAKSTTSGNLHQNNEPLRDGAVGVINSSTASSMLYQNHELPKNRVVGSTNSTASSKMYQSHELARYKDVASTNSAPSDSLYRNHEPPRDTPIVFTTTASNFYQKHELARERPVASTKSTTSGNLHQNNEPLRDGAVGAINSSTASSNLYQNHELPKNRVVGSTNTTTSSKMYQSYELARDKDLASTNSAPSNNLYQNHEPPRDRAIGSTTTASNLYQKHELGRERPVASTKSTTTSNLYQNHEPSSSRAAGSTNTTTTSNLYQNHEPSKDRSVGPLGNGPVVSTNSTSTSNLYQNHEPASDRAVCPSNSAGNLFPNHEPARSYFPATSTSSNVPVAKNFPQIHQQINRLDNPNTTVPVLNQNKNARKEKPLLPEAYRFVNPPKTNSEEVIKTIIQFVKSSMNPNFSIELLLLLNKWYLELKWHSARPILSKTMKTAVTKTLNEIVSYISEKLFGVFCSPQQKFYVEQIIQVVGPHHREFLTSLLPLFKINYCNEQWMSSVIKLLSQSLPNLPPANVHHNTGLNVNNRPNPMFNVPVTSHSSQPPPNYFYDNFHRPLMPPCPACPYNENNPLHRNCMLNMEHHRMPLSYPTNPLEASTEMQRRQQSIPTYPNAAQTFQGPDNFNVPPPGLINPRLFLADNRSVLPICGPHPNPEPLVRLQEQNEATQPKPQKDRLDIIPIMPTTSSPVPTVSNISAENSSHEVIIDPGKETMDNISEKEKVSDSLGNGRRSREQSETSTCSSIDAEYIEEPDVEDLLQTNFIYNKGRTENVAADETPTVPTAADSSSSNISVANEIQKEETNTLDVNNSSESNQVAQEEMNIDSQENGGSENLHAVSDAVIVKDSSMEITRGDSGTDFASQVSSNNNLGEVSNDIILEKVPPVTEETDNTACTSATSDDLEDSKEGTKQEDIPNIKILTNQMKETLELYFDKDNPRIRYQIIREVLGDHFKDYEEYLRYRMAQKALKNDFDPNEVIMIEDDEDMLVDKATKEKVDDKPPKLIKLSPIKRKDGNDDEGHLEKRLRTSTPSNVDTREIIILDEDVEISDSVIEGDNQNNSDCNQNYITTTDSVVKDKEPANETNAISENNETTNAITKKLLAVIDVSEIPLPPNVDKQLQSTVDPKLVRSGDNISTNKTASKRSLDDTDAVETANELPPSTVGLNSVAPDGNISAGKTADVTRKSPTVVTNNLGETTSAIVDYPVPSNEVASETGLEDISSDEEALENFRMHSRYQKRLSGGTIDSLESLEVSHCTLINGTVNYIQKASNCDFFEKPLVYTRPVTPYRNKSNDSDKNSAALAKDIELTIEKRKWSCLANVTGFEEDSSTATSFVNVQPSWDLNYTFPKFGRHYPASPAYLTSVECVSPLNSPPYDNRYPRVSPMPSPNRRFSPSFSSPNRSVPTSPAGASPSLAPVVSRTSPLVSPSIQVVLATTPTIPALNNCKVDWQNWFTEEKRKGFFNVDSASRRQSVETVSSAGSDYSKYSHEEKCCEVKIDSKTFRIRRNLYEKIPKGKLCYVRESNTLIRYFDDGQIELFIRNLNISDGSSIASDLLKQIKGRVEGLSDVDTSLGQFEASGKSEVIKLSKDVSFSTADNFSDPQLYVEEVEKVQRFIPRDFYGFYKYVTGYQIVNNHTPISFQTFLTMHNTNGIRGLFKSYVNTLVEGHVVL